MCNVKNGPCIGKYGCILEMVCSDRAAQLKAERLRNNNQQLQADICPACKGSGVAHVQDTPFIKVCHICGGTGKRSAV